MTVPVKVDVSANAREVLNALAHGDPDILAAGLEIRANWEAKSGLDPRSYSLVKLAALIALAARDPGIEAAERGGERLDFAQRAAGIGIAQP